MSVVLLFASIFWGGWFDIFLACSFGCSFAPEHLVCTTFRAWLRPLSVYVFSSSFILHKLSISVFCILHLYLYLYFRRLRRHRRRCCWCCPALTACLASRFVTAVVVAFVWTFGSTYIYTYTHTVVRDSYTVACSWQKSATATTSHGGCNLFHFILPLSLSLVLLLLLLPLLARFPLLTFHTLHLFSLHIEIRFLNARERRGLSICTDSNRNVRRQR